MDRKRCVRRGWEYLPSSLPVEGIFLHFLFLKVSTFLILFPHWRPFRNKQYWCENLYLLALRVACMIDLYLSKALILILYYLYNVFFPVDWRPLSTHRRYLPSLDLADIFADVCPAVDFFVAAAIVGVTMKRLLGEGKAADSTPEALLVEQHIRDQQLVLRLNPAIASKTWVDGIWNRSAIKLEFVQRRFFVCKRVIIRFVLANFLHDLNLRAVVVCGSWWHSCSHVVDACNCRYNSFLFVINDPRTIRKTLERS